MTQKVAFEGSLVMIAPKYSKKPFLLVTSQALDPYKYTLKHEKNSIIKRQVPIQVGEYERKLTS